MNCQLQWEVETVQLLGKRNNDMNNDMNKINTNKQIWYHENWKANCNYVKSIMNNQIVLYLVIRQKKIFDIFEDKWSISDEFFTTNPHQIAAGISCDKWITYTTNRSG